MRYVALRDLARSPYPCTVALAAHEDGTSPGPLAASTSARREKRGNCGDGARVPAVVWRVSVRDLPHNCHTAPFLSFPQSFSGNPLRSTAWMPAKRLRA